MNDVYVTAENVDLSNCDREQVQFSGAVQPHGCMLVIEESSLRILQMSTNCAELLGVPQAELRGGTLETALAARTPAIAERLRHELLENGPSHLAKLAGTDLRSGRALNLFGHRCGGVTILEFEIITECAERKTLDLHSGSRSTIAKLSNTKTLQAFFDLAVSEIRLITGFERVMAYKFLDDGRGHVIAESAAEGLRSYLDLHFPAGDIPQPARRLFGLSGLRHLPNVEYEPIPLIPACTVVASEPIDLSYAMLRSVSHMYTRYLTNMGVKASMVMPLVREGVLWGLLVCHHETAPRHVAYESRMAAEFLAQMISLMMVAKEDAESLADRLRMKTVFDGMMRSLKANSEVHTSLCGAGPANIGAYIDAGGAAVVTKGQISKFGKTPSEENIRDITSYLANNADLLIASDRLSEQFPPAAKYASTAAGVLAVRLSQQSPEYVMWFRPEQAQTVRWAGDPKKQIEVDESDGSIRRIPRTSFAIWKESVKGRSAPWADFEIKGAADLRRAIVEVVIEARNAHLAAIVASSSDSILGETLDGTVTSWNAGAEHLFGYSAREIIGQSITLIIPPDRIDEEMGLLTRIGVGERINHYETVRVTKDGQRLDVSLTISALRDASGKVIGASKIIRDITDRNRRELALRQIEGALLRSQRRMRNAADAAGLTYVDVDLASGRIRVAENFSRVIRHTSQDETEGADPPGKSEKIERIMSNLFSHVDPADLPRIRSAFLNFLDGARPSTVEYRVRGDDGVERWIEGMWNLEVGPDGRPARVFSTFLDITKIVESRKALVVAKAEADRANEAKSKFLATASHDLRQPVQSLTMLMSVIKRQVADRPKVAEAAQMATDSIKSLNKMLTGFLDISRLDAGVIQPVFTSVDVGEMVSRLAREYAPRAAADGLALRCRPRDFHVRADAALLERILRNLLENALRYTDKGGMFIGLRRRGDRVRLDVIDTGIGIPLDKQAEIFEEFRQLGNPARDASQGLGLGLAIVSRLAKLLKAEVQVRSRLGRGTRFSLLLPQAHAAPVAVLSRPAVDHPGGRVLVIEDNMAVRRAYQAMLEFSGYDVLGAETGEEALALAAREGWRIDAILADHRLGAGLTGTAAAKEISRRAGHAIPTMVVTGDTAREPLLEVSASGFAMLHKPVDVDELCGTLASLLSDA
jgi:PAS domain S-box-containing protein